MPRWIEVTLRVKPDSADAVAAIMQRYGYQGVAIEHEGIPPDKLDEDQIPPATELAVRAYLPEDERVEDTKARLDNALDTADATTPTYRIVEETDWAEAWKVHYHTTRIGKRLVIRPLWEQADLQPNDVEIALDPGMAFGTGTHPTTQLCLEALEALIVPGAKVLDLGCGSGILSIAAAKLGALSILALDIDPVAVEAAQKNIEQNGTADKVSVQEGSLENVVTSARRFDLLLCNILARIIIQMCQQHLGEVVRPGGLAIFSGLILEQADDVEAALRTAGLDPYARRLQGDWVVIEARRPHDLVQ